jgi:hypothetical protein
MFSNNVSLLLIEASVYLAVAVGALSLPRIRFGWLSTVRAAYMRLAAKTGLSILFVIAIVLVGRGTLLPLLPPPVPGVHDEYSYMLAGETFASGRLTNPPHPLWPSFETFYVIQQPTYASMYPPAQGLALAVGYLLGHPWIGVYLSVALMCGAICWMLQGWVPRHWALTGALLAAVRWGMFSYWMESYWGGAAAALGGALAAGALPRLVRGPSIGTAAVLGASLLILANSRPFEGFLFSLLVLGALVLWTLRRGTPDLARLFVHLVLPLTVVLFLGMLGMGYYFWRITGNPFRMPYQVHEATYEVTDPFIWQPLRKAPSSRYVVMQKYHVGRETAAYRQAHSMHGWTLETWRKAESLAFFYFWPAILPTLFALPMFWRNRKARFALLAGTIMFLGLTVELWPMTLHYHAPITALMILLLVQVMRYWRMVQWRGRAVGIAISQTIPLFCATVLAVRLGAAILHIPVPEHGLVPWFTVTSGNLDRARVLRYLQGKPGTHLVLVRYKDTHHVDEEWVHNEANIDAAKVVWAREQAPKDNAGLFQYFPRNIPY